MKKSAPPKIIKAPPPVVRCAPPRRWGIAEWGSLASIIGVCLWAYDQTRKGKPV